MLNSAKIAMLAGIPEARVQKWADAGLFARVREGTETLVARAHVLSQLERAGVSLAVMQAADREDVLARAYIFEFLQVAREGENSFHQVRERSGIEEQLLLRICDALGIDDPSCFSDAESAMLEALGEAMREGLPRGMAVELCEVWGAQMRFAAHAEVISYDVNISSPAINSAASPIEAAVKLAPLTRAMLRVSDLYPQALHRRHLLQATNLTTDTFLLEQAPNARILPPGEVLISVGFVDLTGYTTLTEEEGDRQALAYARQLERLVRSASHAHDMRIVKRLGDGFMVGGSSVAEMLSGLLYVVRAAAERDDMPTARAGVAFGSAVSRGGDYFGHTVNLAARVLDQADPSEVLVTDDCVEQARSGPFTFHEPRDATLKGIREPVRLWRVESLSGRPVLAAE